MKLTRASSYAVHAVLHMAANEDQGGPMASHNIAKAQEIPERFLLKVLKPLVSAGLLLSLRGPNGGYRLAKPSSKISLLDVLEAVEGPIRGNVTLTPGRGQSNLDKRLENLCDEVADMAKKRLAKVTLADLARK
jgi:Rrf2 family protein